MPNSWATLNSSKVQTLQRFAHASAAALVLVALEASLLAAVYLEALALPRGVGAALRVGGAVAETAPSRACSSNSLD